MRAFFTTILVMLGVAAFALYSSFFIVHQNEQALVLQFGEVKRVVKEPGLNWMIPVVQTVGFFDKRIIDLDTRPQEVIVSDQKRLVVDAFARYRIIDPLKYYQTVNNEIGASARIGDLLTASLRRVLGNATFRDVVRDKREDLMREITAQVSEEAAPLGVEIIDVRIKRADLPEQNRESIYRRMQTERQREAAEFRARGEEQSRRIKADADRQVTIIKAEATKKSEIIRGEGDAARNAIFAEAFSQDPDFFAFYRSMQAYESSLHSNDTRLLLSPNSDFFRYFTDPSGKAPRE